MFVNWLHTIFDPDTKLEPASNAGSPIKVEKLLQLVNGRYDLVETGESNLYEQIQSHKDSVDIYKILERFQNGDVNALNKVAGNYIDITDAPATLADAYTFIGNASRFFEKLPLKIREEYDFDASKFVGDLGSSHCNELLSSVFGSTSEPVVPDVVEPAPIDSVVPKDGDVNA